MVASATRIFWKFFFIFSAVFTYPASTYAANFSSTCNTQIEQSAGCTILLTGEIVKGDNQRLVDLLRSQKSGSNFFRTILLKSPGGSISEALLIAQSVTQNVLNTATTVYWKKDELITDSYCVSACFLIWVAGAERMHFSSPSKNGRKPIGLGLHRPYFSKEDFANLDPLTAAKNQQDLIAQVRAYLKRQDVADNLIDEMMKRSSKEVYWLNSIETTDELDQRAPWFEELMISRCGFDPNAEKEDNMEIGKQLTDLHATGKKPDLAKRKKYLAWRQSYNSCEYEFRKSSQAKFIAVK